MVLAKDVALLSDGGSSKLDSLLTTFFLLGDLDYYCSFESLSKSLSKILEMSYYSTLSARLLAVSCIVLISNKHTISCMSL